MTTYEALGTVPQGSTQIWRDRKRYLWLIGFVVPSLVFVAFVGYLATGWGVWFWLGPMVILIVVPAIDLLTGLDRSNPPDNVIEALENDRYYRWVVYAYLPIQYVGFCSPGTRSAGAGCRSTWPTRSPSPSRSAVSAASASTPLMSCVTRRRASSVGSERSLWHRVTPSPDQRPWS